MTTSEPISPAEPVHERPLLDEKALRVETDWGVGLARVSGLETTGKNKPFQTDPLSAVMFLFAVFIVGSAVHLVLLLGVPSPVFFGVIVTIGLCWIILNHAREKSPIAPFSDLMTPRTVGEIVNGERRVWCVGKDRPLSLVLKDGPIRDESFEPVLVPIWRPLLDTRAIVVGIAAWVPMFVGFFFLLLQFPILKNVQLAGMWATFIFGALAASFFRRRYFRITPGTLELMEYGFLGRSTPRVTRYDLRASRVIVELNTNMVYITEPNGTLHEVRIEDSRTRYTFARAVLEAAVSTARVPALPRDRFTD